MSGTAHTGVELARHLGLSRSTVSEHVAVLVAAGIVTVESQGRHRYVRIAGPEVARQLEQLVVLASSGPPPRPALPADLAFARSCYDHLAGSLGVHLHDRMVDVGYVGHDGGSARHLTDRGRGWFADLGIPLPGDGPRPLVRGCLDWSERRPHLAGPAARALLAHMLAQGWVRRHPSRPRVVVCTAVGRAHLATHLDLEVT